MSVDLSGFDPIAAPPMTRAKMDMIEATRSDDVENLEAVINQGSMGVSAEVVSTSHLNNALRSAGFQTMTARRLGKALEELGFVQYGTVIKFDGKTCRFAVRGKMAEKMANLEDGHQAMFRSELRGAVTVSEFD